MGRLRFVQPEVVRLPLSDGDWLDVKRRLSVGEARSAVQQMIGEVNPQGWRRPNIEMAGLSEIAAYIVDWSLRDAQDKPVKVSISALQQLDADSFAEIEKAVEAHIKAMDAELEAAKNVRAAAGEIKSEQTSRSVAS